MTRNERNRAVTGYMENNFPLQKKKNQLATEQTANDRERNSGKNAREREIQKKKKKETTQKIKRGNLILLIMLVYDQCIGILNGASR